MGRYKYVTPSWLNYYKNEYIGDSTHPVKTYNSTNLCILNDSAQDVRIDIYFYNEGGYEHEDLRVTDFKIGSHYSHFFRLGDHFEKTNPEYNQLYSHRAGWLKIVATGQLRISGTINSGVQTLALGTQETCYPIPFFETALEDRKLYEPIDTGNFEPIGNKKPNFPRPFPK